MSSLIGKPEDSTIQEGFLCPVCVQNFDSVFQLQGHLESAHVQDRGLVRNQLRGFFGKAKRILKQRPGDQELHVDNIEAISSIDISAAFPGTDPNTWDSQDEGQSRSHWESYRAYRSSRIDRVVVETNKLLIRLEKLMRQGPPWSDQSKRKAFEKSVTPWIDDKDVKHCPSCGDKFGLKTRKHHCRLCGTILCNKCSRFMTEAYTEKVLNPSSLSQPEPSSEGGDEKALRVCKECNVLIDQHLMKVKEKVTKPQIIILYEKIAEVKEKIIARIPAYNEIVKALRNGDESCSLDQATEARNMALKLFDMLDVLSNKILSLKGSDDSPNLKPSTQMLHRRIRSHVVRFLQENTIELYALPSAEEVKRWKAEKKAEIARRLEEERLSKMKQMQSASQSKSSSYGSPKKQTQDSPQKQEVGTGWRPASVDLETVEAMTDDPLVQQMNIISGYLNQAHHMGKHDEALMLEANLKELQKAFRERDSAF